MNINPNAIYIGDSIGDKTIELEVQNSLDEIALNKKHGPSVYIPGTSGINKEFVKGFKKAL